MDDGTNFLSVKRGQIILILIFSLLFKANYEECMAPPPSKKARDDKTAPSVPAPMQPGFKLKREWTASYNMVNPAEAMQDHEIAGPVAQEHSANPTFISTIQDRRCLYKPQPNLYKNVTPPVPPPSNMHYLVLQAPKPRRIMQM
jgi:hypothetical protein